MIYSTKSAWTEDYLKDNQITQTDENGQIQGQSYLAKKRAPFVPFLLRNKTGCALWFGTLTTSPAKAVGNSELRGDGNRRISAVENIQSWKEVLPDQEVPVRFESRNKMRHKVK